uniref:Protein PLASTID MOVEMENT IMPAIRED 2 n=1 Tax=Kalanchoe fedtschenkoi TaxID=63787 RepID=A0A7N0U255_KALFE
MDTRQVDDTERIGSVKAAINMFGERISDGKYSPNKLAVDYSEKQSLRTRAAHRARRDIDGYNERRQVAESAKAQAEAELYKAKKVLKDLTSRIEETRSTARAQRSDVEMMKKTERSEEESPFAGLMKELESVKRDLSRLKLDMKSVLEEKMLAEKEIEAAKLKLSNQAAKAEEIKMEIEEANEEQVLVELAKIEALKEFEAIEQKRELETRNFASKLADARRQKDGIVKEMESAKELESKLACTMSDVDMLRNELTLLKELDSVVRKSGSFSYRQDEEEQKRLLESVNRELEEAKMELGLIKGEGFQFMASMDVVRNELRRVMEEAVRLRNAEDKADTIVKNLNSKLVRAKSKLEAVTAAEEKAKAIATNLALTLEQLNTEAEAAKKEKEAISEEIESLKAEMEKTECDIDTNEEKLRIALGELELVKSSEAEALEKLRLLSEEVMRARAVAAQSGSFITISKFEFEYLTGRASGAEEIADKKVAAAQAWIEALKAGEREILTRTELVRREIKELRLEEEHEAFRADKSVLARRVVEGELQRKKRGNDSESDMQLAAVMPRKSFKENGSLTPIRRPIRIRMSGSPATRRSKSGSFAGKNRTKGTNLSVLFGGKTAENAD